MPTEKLDVFQAHWLAAQRYIFDKRLQAEICKQTPRAMPRFPEGFDEIWPHITAITPMDPWRAAGVARRLHAVRNVPGDIIECGVFMGAMSAMMGVMLKRWGIRKKIYMLDSFRGLPAPDPKVDDFYSAGWFAADRHAVEMVINKAGIADMVVIMPGWFHETLPQLTDERFCLAHLDGDLYSSTTVCLEQLVPRMEPGGVVVLDDYFDEGHGVKRAADEHLAETGDQLFAGPVTQAYFFPGKPARDANKRGVKASVTELRKDTAYVNAVKTVAGWLKRDAAASRKMQTLLSGR
ncbi:MAG: TylF/MycF/NovP-related O-methyltransferase [Myxococcota bacterium]